MYNVLIITKHFLIYPHTLLSSCQFKTTAGADAEISGSKLAAFATGTFYSVEYHSMFFSPLRDSALTLYS